MPVADEICFENGLAPVFFFFRRARRAHEPTRLGGAGPRPRAQAQEKCGDIPARAGKRQPPACHQIEDLGLARNLDHDGTKRRTGKRIGGRTQSIGRIGDAQQEHARRIDAQFQKPRRRKFAEFERGKILTYPEQAFVRSHAHGEPSRETRRCRFVACGAREDFVQRAGLKPAFQAGIRKLVAKRNTGVCFQRLQPRFGERGAKPHDLFRRSAYGSQIA